MKTLLVLALACVPVVARADDKSDAQALFDRGIAEMKDGKLDDACKHLAASLAKLPDSGTQGALALCTTKQGKLATAWALWKELAVTAPTDAMKSSAARAATELEPRLPRYQIKSKPPIAGLVVKLNGTAVDLGVDVPLPVDPGKVIVTASAPDHEDWTGEVAASEGQVTSIDIPALKAKPQPMPITPETPAPIVVASPKRNMLAIGLAAGGGVSLIAGAVFGFRASSKWSDAEKACGDVDACPGGVFAQAKADHDSAQTSATISTVLIGVGAAALVGAGVVWYVKRGSTTERTAIVPTVTPEAAGLTVIGSWR
jgi:hypothetical protein